MSAYKERFPAGTRVRISSRDDLEAFRARWMFHNPLTPEQLAWAERDALVKEVGFYHGGYPLYVLAGVPGVWHEECLSAC